MKDESCDVNRSESSIEELAIKAISDSTMTWDDSIKVFELECPLNPTCKESSKWCNDRRKSCQHHCMIANTAIRKYRHRLTLDIPSGGICLGANQPWDSREETSSKPSPDQSGDGASNPTFPGLLWTDGDEGVTTKE